ncbi:ABC transporter substrate-binding protein, partial [Erysipelotrichaceae bacterium OttesenSCG-928-M19]|nr:ABC transporter substrate-binding protein [Erysipelotrichaceae bacterium OttesenSCG-928-M19]
GKKVIISENTVIDFLNDQLLNEAGLTSDDIEKVVIAEVPLRLEALNNKQADAVILPAPYDTFAVEQGNKIIKTIVNEEQQISMLLLNDTILENNDENIANFVKAYNEAVAYLNTVDPNEISELIVETVGYSEENTKTIKLPKFLPITLPSESKIEDALNWSKEKKIIDKDLNAKDLMVDIGNVSN